MSHSFLQELLSGNIEVFPAGGLMTFPDSVLRIYFIYNLHYFHIICTAGYNLFNKATYDLKTARKR